MISVLHHAFSSGSRDVAWSSRGLNFGTVWPNFDPEYSWLRNYGKDSSFPAGIHSMTASLPLDPQLAIFVFVINNIYAGQSYQYLLILVSLRVLVYNKNYKEKNNKVLHELNTKSIKIVKNYYKIE